MSGRSPAQRAARLLRWYPAPWRARYGAEFTELLISDIEERPRSAARGLDVARGGLIARLGGAGLAGCPLPGAGGTVTAQARCVRVSASLGSLACVLALFLTAGAVLCSELVIDRQVMPAAARPGPAALAATDVISAAMLVLLGLAVLAAVPVLAALAARFRPAGRAGRVPVRVPAAVLLAGAAFLFAGGRHFGNGWPGTGGHGSFVPAGLAAFQWAVSLSVSAYWAHPASFFGSFPRPEVLWMATSPLALAACVVAAAVLVRRAGLSPRLLAFEVRLALAACAVLPAVLAAAACWVATSGGRLVAGSGPRLFHAGLIDLACTALLAVTLPAAAQAVWLARRELRLARSTR
ncbi:MAG TPA: hypothetical protein VHV09_10645 [Trebonia sp.]|nr:hypothetical protein [Trebonia sp.]